jgi:hypothetical protein
VLVGVAIIGTALLAWRRGSLKLLGKEFSFRIIQVYGYKCKRILFKNMNIQDFAGRPSRRIMILFRLYNSFTRLDCDLKNYCVKGQARDKGAESLMGSRPQSLTL